MSAATPDHAPANEIVLDGIRWETYEDSSLASGWIVDPDDPGCENDSRGRDEAVR